MNVVVNLNSVKVINKPCVCTRTMHLSLWPPSVVIGNSLFITGCWKTTWTWIKEAGRKPSRREEKRTNQERLCKPSRELIHANQGHCYAN